MTDAGVKMVKMDMKKFGSKQWRVEAAGLRHGLD